MVSSFHRRSAQEENQPARTKLVGAIELGSIYDPWNGSDLLSIIKKTCEFPGPGSRFGTNSCIARSNLGERHGRRIRGAKRLGQSDVAGSAHPFGFGRARAKG